MKFTRIVSTFLICLLFSFTAQGQKLTFSPEKPTAESEVTFTYDPAGGPLEDIEMAVIAYEYSDVNNPAASDIELTQKGEVYKGKFKLSKDAKAIFFKLISKEDYKIDNNNDQGYGLLVYEAAGNKPVKGARIAYANGISPGMGSYLLAIKGDMTKALELYKKDFEAYPDLKSDHLSMFSFLVSASTDPADMEMLNAHVQSVIGNKKASEDEMMTAYQLANTTENAEQIETLETSMRKRFKKGQLVRDEMYQSFRKATTTEEKLKIFESFKKKFENVEKAKYTLTNMASGLASSFANEENWEKFDEFIALVDDQDRLIGMYNNIAWGLVGAGLDGEGKSLEKAAELSMKSLEGTKAKTENPKDEPSIYTPRELKQQGELSYAMYADTYALIMYKLGKTDEALKYQKIAAKANKFKDAEMNERYSVYYEKIHGKMKCEELIAGMIKDGSATPKMKTRHKELFLENNSLETAYTKYLASLEADALKKIKEDLAKKMIDEVAPDFTLTNVAGETVQLSAMKDKVVVVDFWATWCGPCIMSFPGMARAQEELKEQEDVVFLFINTWENGDDKAKIAGDFMKKKGYPFNIPMDSEDKVVKSYGVDGIPTKFIIGPDNRIRFKSVGFNNNEDAMVAELKYMIEMAREGEGEMAVGAPR